MKNKEKEVVLKVDNLKFVRDMLDEINNNNWKTADYYYQKGESLKGEGSVYNIRIEVYGKRQK
jgi:hypothetical protein